MWHRLNSYKTTLQSHNESHSNSSSSHVQQELYHASGKLHKKSSVLSSRLKAGRVVDEITSTGSVPDSCCNDWKSSVSDSRQPRQRDG